ncbi:ComEC/Rec2 family competence protein [Pseudomonas sp. P7548]|uniref:ComEC/Rec2 family competence protein n=1 Tax=Pseudomonas sp. P7548 TaxID=2726981 RepID=UPI0015C17E5E|nr:MBL fold metallo-hydrolase [Pseudomonas sp. P7548]NWE18545.1 MBL fold metallo-hydrolase [Pseudomonas sp. P7548]
MDCGEIIILDVGHGNCTIIKHGEEAIIIDAPGRPIVAKVLDDLKIKSIRALLISHADSDHLSGAIPILMNAARPVQQVYVNPDKRKTDSWLQFRIAAGDARKFQGTKVYPSLSIDSPQQLTICGTTIRVLHPTPEICLATNEGAHIDGVRLDANSMSAVVLIEHEGERMCLLAADSGRHSLNTMMGERVDISAHVLVFPHHGGHIGGASDNKEFAKELVSAVRPKLVLFSLGRGAHGTPRPEIVAGAREAIAGSAPYIACTQISKNCSDALPGKSERPLVKNSEGLAKNHCCAGTIILPLSRGGLEGIMTDLSDHHGKFVASEVPNALCRRQIAPVVPQIIAATS